MSGKTSKVLEYYPAYEATIGIEVHVQLKTQSKIFCTCPNSFGHKPNTNICPICAGYPGVLPTPNRRVIDYAIMAGLATNCAISPECDFARKHYIYPDLPKNYQVTQGEIAICMDGWITTQTIEEVEKKIRIQRIHIEEDAGKVLHMPNGKSYVDLNRTGTPLLEIVSHPDIANAHEARRYLMNLRSIIQYLGISDVNMEEGSFRADINISVKKKEAEKLGTRAEVKNVNSFKFIAQAINYEIERQIETLESGDIVHQETRLWNEKEQKTVFMRSKEGVDDYRYFTEPDLPIIKIDDEWKERIRKQIPELPLPKKERFMRDYHLSAYEAGILIQDKALADYFEATLIVYPKKPKLVCNWILRDVLGALKEQKVALIDFAISASMLADLIKNIDSGVISSSVAQEVFNHMMATGKMATEVITEKGLEQVSDTGQLRQMCEELLNSNPDVVKKYKAGNDRLLGFFIGQVMKAMQGKGNPQLISKILKELLQ